MRALGAVAVGQRFREVGDAVDCWMRRVLRVFAWNGKLFPFNVSGLHRFGIMDLIGVNFIDASVVLAAESGQGGVEAAVRVLVLLSRSLQMFSVESGTIPGCLGMLKHPVRASDRYLAFLAITHLATYGQWN